MIDGVGLAIAYTFVLFFTFQLTFQFAFDLLSPIALGDKNYEQYGLLLHRCIILFNIMFVFLFILHYFTASKIMLLFKMDLKQYEYFDDFLKIYNIHYLFYLMYAIFARFINIIGKGYVMVIIMIISLGINIGLNYLLIVYCELSVRGAAIVFIITYVVICLFQCLYLYIFKPLPEVLFCLKRESFTLLGFWEYLKVYLSIIVIVLGVTCNKEILIIIAFSWLSSTELAAIISIFYLSRIFFSISIGICISTVSTTGYYLGQKEFNKIFPILFFTTIFSLSLVTLVLIFFIIFKDNVINSTTSNAEIFKLIDSCFVFMSIFVFLESISMNLCYWFRALGAKVFSVVVPFIQYIIIQPSLSIILIKYYRLGVTAIWISCIVGEALTLVTLLTYFILFFHIEKSCNEVYNQYQLSFEEFRKDHCSNSCNNDNCNDSLKDLSSYKRLTKEDKPDIHIKEIKKD